MRSASHRAVLTEEDHCLHARRVDHGVTPEETRIFQSKPVLKADIAGDTKRQTKRWIEGKFHDGYSGVRQRLDVEPRFCRQIIERIL